MEIKKPDAKAVMKKVLTDNLHASEYYYVMNKLQKQLNPNEDDPAQRTKTPRFYLKSIESSDLLNKYNRNLALSRQQAQSTQFKHKKSSYKSS